jgi:serine/threonine protein kinase/Flp pilus assembly protein TadD
MKTESADSLDADDRLGAVLAACLEALDKGEADEPALLAQYPEYAAELKELFADQERVDRVAASLRPAAQVAQAAPRELGDFGILREIGRGGMGIVYEADQVSLGRRVALKVLPFAGAMDSRQLQRFKIEAQAAAQLHHTNIVPVYYVGCERGVHFYAMQYIEGHSLADVIAELRGQAGDAATKPRPSPRPPVEATVDPPAGQVIATDSANGGVRHTNPIAALSTVRSVNDAAYFRTVAELGIQAAEALDFAHEHGIIHRDIKPANLLVDADSRLWVTDFGLAQVQGDARMTMTGDLVGTLRYMSPEQALAKRVVVDHRTDVYSLGATLYELLTLEPVFGGTDRQELLQQIAFEEPRRPHRVNRAIPAELETIVLKALEKNPADRYATAQELADDLRRFLENRPIQARRPSWGRVAAKWVRRHRGLVGSLTAGAVLSIGVLLAGLVWHNAKLHDAAEREHDLAENANNQKEEADRKRAFARRAADRMYTEVAEKWLANEPGSEKLQREFLEEALRFYQELAGETGEDPAVRRDLANAHRRMGEIFLKLGQPDKAEAALNKALAIVEALTTEHPEQAEYQGDRANIYFHLGNLNSQTPRLVESEKAFRRCLEIHRKQAAQSPSAPGPEIGTALINLGIVYMRTRQLTEAEETFREARRVYKRLTADFPDIPGHHVALGGALNNLAILLLQKRKLDEARLLLEEAIAHQRTALRMNPRSKQAIVFLDNHYSSLAGVLHELGKTEEVLNAAKESLAAAELLVLRFPETASHRSSLAQSQFNVGRALLEAGHLREAEDAFRSALKTMDEAARDFPKAPFNGGLQAGIHHELGRLLTVNGHHRDALAEYQKALELKRNKSETLNNLALLLAEGLDAPSREPARAVDLANRAVELQRNNWEIRRTLGVVHYRAGNWKAAITALEEAQQLRGQGDEIVALFLAMTHWQRGNRDLAREFYDQARELAKGIDAVHADLRRYRSEAAETLGSTAEEKPEQVPPPKVSRE